MSSRVGERVEVGEEAEPLTHVGLLGLRPRGRCRLLLLPAAVLVPLLLRLAPLVRGLQQAGRFIALESPLTLLLPAAK